MIPKDVTEMMIHKATPSEMGLYPTSFNIFILIPAPTKKMVQTKMERDENPMISEIILGMLMIEFKAIATIKNKINNGTFTLFSPPLNIHIEIKETGIIHNARDTLTVVATSKASSPYAIAAPTTELVS